MQFSLFCFFVFSIFLFFGIPYCLGKKKTMEREWGRKKRCLHELLLLEMVNSGTNRLASDTNTEMYILNDDILWWPFIWSILSRPITNSKYVDCVVKGQGHEIYDRIFFLQNTLSLSLMNRLKQFHTFFYFRVYIHLQNLKFACPRWTGILPIRVIPNFQMLSIIAFEYVNTPKYFLPDCSFN